MATKGWENFDIEAYNAKRQSKPLIYEPDAGMRQPTAQQRTQSLGRMKAGKMNKTEQAYAARLETLKHAGEILWYAFEPINIRLADKCFYRVDFMVMLAGGAIECHETKGGHITADSFVKIKMAAQILPFQFCIMQLEKGVWKRRDF